MFLNNRHYDPATGVFVSVDPLVTITGEPYIYGGGNPVTYSDANGLAKCSTSTYVLGGPAYGCTEVNVPATGGNSSGGPPSSGDVHSTNSTPARGWKMASSQPRQWQIDRDAARGRVENGSVPPNWQDVAVAYGCYPDSSGCASSIDTMMAGIELVLFLSADPRQCVGDSSSGVGCGVEVVSAVPWGKGSKFLKFLRYGDEATGIARVCGFRSFSADILVLMADGSLVPISQVEVGDVVLAEDPESGERGPRKVTHLWVHRDQLLDLLTEEGPIRTTEDHPFWNESDREWQWANQIDPGEDLLTVDGGLVAVDGLNRATAANGWAYNLTVEGIHTYYVAVGPTAVLVHNTGCANAMLSVQGDRRSDVINR